MSTFFTPVTRQIFSDWPICLRHTDLICVRLSAEPPILVGRQNNSQRLELTLTTELGDIDLLAGVAGGETYQTLLSHSFEVEAFGVRFKCIDLPTLIRVKEAADRPKDREMIAELRVLLEEIEKKQA